MTSPQPEPDASLLDLILGPPGEGAFLTTPGDAQHNRPGNAVAYPNTAEGRARYMNDAADAMKQGRNNFLSSVVWDESVLTDDDLKLTKQTPALYYPTLWADVDDPGHLDRERRKQLERRCHVRTQSGTPRRFHLRLPLAQPITDRDEFERLNRRLADALGGVDAAKSYPYMWLTTPGSIRFKPEYPKGRRVSMSSMNEGQRWTADELGVLFDSWGVEQRDVRSHAGSGAIVPEAINWDAIPRTVREHYKQIDVHDDKSKGYGAFLKRCATQGLTMGQALWLSLDDPEGLVPSRYSQENIENQITGTYQKFQTPPTGKVSGKQERGMTSARIDNNSDNPFEPDNLRLRRLDEMEEQVFEPVGVGLYEGAVTVLIGDEESAKTTLTLHLLAALATGKGWAPWDIPAGEPRRVVLIATEPNMVKTRLKLLGVAEDSPHLMVFTDEVGGDFPTFPNDTYTDALLEFDPDFVVIDMWADSVEKLNLKDPQDALAAMKTWVKFATTTSSSVLLLAHTNRNNGQAVKARDIYGLTLALRKSARATIMSFIHPGDGMLYVGVEKINMQHPGDTHRFRIGSVDTGLATRRGNPITVAQLNFEDTVSSKVWDLYLDSLGKASSDEGKMTTGKALVEVLERGSTPRPQAIAEVNQVLVDNGRPEVSPRAIDNAWQTICDEGQAGKPRRNSKREKLWSLVYADHDREDDDCSGD